jgi:GNAT superfamily N-acetyltransferase
MECLLLPADAGDAASIAAIHTESWRDAYRPFLPEWFLAGPIEEDRNRLWQARFAAPDPDRRLVLKAMVQEQIAGFACVLLDEDPEWGPLLDNLHVRPPLKGRGIGRRLFDASREWSRLKAPGQPMHLWVIEDNVAARAFYDRLGGRSVDQHRVEVVPGALVTAIRYVWEPLS